MLVDDLYKEEFNSIPDLKLARTISLLKEAINDWPTDIKNVEDFITEVKMFFVASP